MVNGVPDVLESVEAVIRPLKKIIRLSTLGSHDVACYRQSALLRARRERPKQRRTHQVKKLKL